jgi:hypothetical protein
MTDKCSSAATTGPLLPCPFCGGPATRAVAVVSDCQIRCENDECIGPHTTAFQEGDAVRQWNTRAGVAQSPSLRSALEPFAKYEMIAVGFNGVFSKDDLKDCTWVAGFKGPQPEFKHFQGARESLAAQRPSAPVERGCCNKCKNASECETGCKLACTCGGDPGQPASEHDISCPAAVFPSSAATDYVLMPREATRAMTMAACDRLPSCEHVFGHAGEMLRSAYEQMVKVAAVETSANTSEVPTDALINLVNYQEQCDEDGVMVKVSRQALAEVLLYVQLVRPGLNGGPQAAAHPDVEARIAVLSDALKSISNNTCCDNCQEAARVARSALCAYVGLSRTVDGGKQ